MADDIICEGFFRAAEGAKLSCLDKFQDSGLIQFIFGNLLEAVYNFFAAVLNPGMWLNWTDPQAMMRFIYYGGSVELFFVALVFLIIITAVGIWHRGFMWGCVRVLEGFNNTIGRFVAWAGLLMVLQQIVIVFMQRIFTRPDISFGFGIPLHREDPRPTKVLEVAKQHGTFGLYGRFAEAIEVELTKARGGRAVPMNLDGVGAAVILDLGFHWRSTRMFLLTPRSVSFGAHYLEEQEQDSTWRHIPADQIEYLD